MHLNIEMSLHFPDLFFHMHISISLPCGFLIDASDNINRDLDTELELLTMMKLLTMMNALTGSFLLVDTSITV